jgi:hypothetical protein
MLHRLGLDANLTLGNKKSVDIGVVCGPGHAVTIDVKAVAGKVDWLMGTPSAEPQTGHFVVLVSYEGRIASSNTSPRCWVVRHDEILPHIKSAGSKGPLRYLSRKLVLDKFAPYEGAWDRIALKP